LPFGKSVSGGAAIHLSRRGPECGAVHKVGAGAGRDVTDVALATGDAQGQNPAQMSSKKNESRTLAGLLALGSALLGAAVASADEPGGVTPQAFSAPKLLEEKMPEYPASQHSRKIEGWVQVAFMVDVKGKPYDITVADSSGIEAFERAAVAAVSTRVYEPGTRDGVPVDARVLTQLKFRFNPPARGARPSFGKSWSSLMKEIEAGNRTRAEDLLSQLDAQNLYEDANRELARYHYHRKWGTEAQQILALRRAIASETRPVYLPYRTFVSALEALLTLEVHTNDFAGALGTWERLKPLASKQDVARWQATIDKIEALRTSDDAFMVSGEIYPPTGHWYAELLKRRFQINVTSGQVSEVRVKCEGGYFALPYKPETRYTVQAQSGACGVYIVGSEGTKFELIQL
jgi:TonB family protein